MLIIRSTDNNESTQSPPEEARRKCPTCQARRREEAHCPRCGADLSQLLAVEERADRLYRSARAAYRNGLFRTAAARAAAASSFEARPEFLRFLALAALRSGDFGVAVRAARRVLDVPATT